MFALCSEIYLWLYDHVEFLISSTGLKNQNRICKTSTFDEAGWSIRCVRRPACTEWCEKTLALITETRVGGVVKNFEVV